MRAMRSTLRGLMLLDPWQFIRAAGELRTSAVVNAEFLGWVSCPRFCVGIGYSRSGQFGQVVSRLLVELVWLAQDVGLVDLLRPVFRFDLFHRHRDGLLPVAEHLHHVLRDRLGEAGLL